MSIDINKRTKGKLSAQRNELSKHGEMLIRIDNLIIARVSPEATETDEELEANAAFIVTACNNHDKLIEALKKVVSTDAEAMPRLREDIEQLLNNINE